MANLKKQYCRLCLGVITDESFTIIENVASDMLDMLLLKLSCDGGNNLMCNACSEKLFAAFEFKSNCLYTDNTIRTYAAYVTVLPLDIRDVYMKEIEDKQQVNVLDDYKVCRLCMQLVTGVFVSVQDVALDIFRSYIPEVNFKFTRDPLICNTCMDSIHTHNAFLESCLNALGEIKHNDNGKGTKEESVVNECDRKEDVKIEVNDERKTEMLIETEELQIKSEGYGHDSGTRHKDVAEVETVHGDTSEIQLYKCKTCDYETLRKRNLSYHHSKHRARSQAQTYECGECDYRTKNRYHFRSHELKHKDISEVQKIYQCETCNYRTKYRWGLTSHQLKHRNTSEIQIYKCNECDYHTYHKSNLAKHQLRHRNESEVQMYKCNKCDYQTKRKRNLAGHELTHRDTSEIQMYECKECGFQTKHKGNLVSHQKRHRDSSEVQMHACTECDFQTKYKWHLIRHQLTHRNASEVQIYKCEECDFGSKYKGNLASHQLRHRDASEVQSYKCNECDYRTKYKSDLTRHQLKHGKVRGGNAAGAIEEEPSTMLVKQEFCE